VTIGFILSWGLVMRGFFGQAAGREHSEQGEMEVMCLLHPKHNYRVTLEL